MPPCDVAKTALTWWCVFGTVAVVDRVWRSLSDSYVRPLAQRLGLARGLGVSMREKDHCAENALAERMNGILKNEYGLGQSF